MSGNKDTNTCETCRFFDEHPAINGVRGGHCKRRSPLVTGGMMSDVATVWPWMGVADWCGEHEELGPNPNTKLRDDFAAAALTGLAANREACREVGEEARKGLYDDGRHAMAVLAYNFADAMLSARGEQS